MFPNRRRKLFQVEVCVHKTLIVDDDKAMCDLLRACLSEGYEVIDTVDPEQALGLALEHKPDAILLDLMMPKFSGFELCQSFRSLSYTSTIPILVITGETEAKYKDHCATLGAVAYFEKPLKLDELRRSSPWNSRASGRNSAPTCVSACNLPSDCGALTLAEKHSRKSLLPKT